MVKKEVWGNITWLLFHTLAEKIKEEYFDESISILFKSIKSICFNLPCPYCAQHAREELAKVNSSLITNKQRFKEFLFAFHNKVNENVNYPKQTLDILDKYKTANIDLMVQFFVQTHKQEAYNNKLMLHKYWKNQAINEFTDWFYAHRHFFEN